MWWPGNSITIGTGFHVVATETLTVNARTDSDGFVGGSGEEELIVFSRYDELALLEHKKVGGTGDLNDVGTS